MLTLMTCDIDLRPLEGELLWWMYGCVQTSNVYPIASPPRRKENDESESHQQELSDMKYYEQEG